TKRRSVIRKVGSRRSLIFVSSRSPNKALTRSTARQPEFRMQPRNSRDQASQDSSRPEFWDARYARGETPWDFHGVPAALKAFLKTSPTGSALIPGCGSAYEVRAFDEAGWKVMAIDFSPIAVERARSQLGSLADRVVQDDFF